MTSSLRDKVVIITGGAHGQGAAEAMLVAEEGGIPIIADIDDKTGSEFAATESLRYVRHDVTESTSWRLLVNHVIEEFGRIDGLVNNAGIYRRSNLFDSPSDNFARVVGVNQLGTLLGIETVAGPMRDQGFGSIINVSSIAGMRGMADIVYAGSKWAVRGMSRSAARHLAPYGVRVNTVLPGFVDTALLRDDIGLDNAQSNMASIPLGRPGKPRDIASVVGFLLSDESAYCTGAELVVDGGFLA